MKINYLFFMILTIVGITFSSCIKDEALNTEADIETALISAEFTKQPANIENDFITFFINSKADITKLAPTFTLSEGATISPASGTELDFTNPQLYTVTSQSGAYKKTYKVSAYTAEISSKFSFENVRTFSNGGFYEWVEKDGDKEAKIWDSGNAGFFLSFLTTPNDRPNKDNFITTIEPEGKVGKGVRLQTQKTGEMGQMFAPIAAGNIFTGTFETNILNPAESPKFGTAWSTDKVPTKMTGYFKYKAGTEYINTSKDSQQTTDSFNIYAIFFKVDQPNDYIKATHKFRFITDPTDNPNVVSYALIKPEDRIETNEWTYFELPFTTIHNREVDPTAQYKLAIVLTSSIEGELYNGAIGSTLSIDEIEILTDK